MHYCISMGTSAVGLVLKIPLFQLRPVPSITLGYLHPIVIKVLYFIVLWTVLFSISQKRISNTFNFLAPHYLCKTTLLSFFCLLTCVGCVLSNPDKTQIMTREILAPLNFGVIRVHALSFSIFTNIKPCFVTAVTAFFPFQQYSSLHLCIQRAWNCKYYSPNLLRHFKRYA